MKQRHEADTLLLIKLNRMTKDEIAEWLKTNELLHDGKLYTLNEEKAEEIAGCNQDKNLN